MENLFFGVLLLLVFLINPGRNGLTKLKAIWKRGFPCGLWVLTLPWPMFVSGFEKAVLVYLFAASALFLSRQAFQADEKLTTWLHRLQKWVEGKPWGRVIVLISLVACIGLWGVGYVMAIALVGMALPLVLIGLVPMLIGLIAYINNYRSLILIGIIFLIGRTFLGGEGGRGLDHPVVLVAWALVVGVLVLSLVNKSPRWIVLCLGLNLVSGIGLMEFYLNPLAGQVSKISVQKGVELIGKNSSLDYRWALEGCEGQAILGFRKFSSTREKGNVLIGKDAFDFGGAASDNGAVDCAFKTLMVSDQSRDGRLQVVSLPDKKVLYKNKEQTGFAGLVYSPARAWLFASLESKGFIYWLNLRNPNKIIETLLPAHAAHPAVCQRFETPCMIAIGHKRLYGFYGEGLERRVEVPRPGRSLGPTLAINEETNEVVVGDFLSPQAWVLDLKTLQKKRTYLSVPGIRYLIYWPHLKETWAANFLTGWFYIWDKNGKLQRKIFGGKKTRWLNLSRDGKRLIWCAASACYSYKPDA